MPTPLATAGRDTSWGTGTASQSLIECSECRSARRVSTDEAPACLLNHQSLPSMIDDSQRDDLGSLARTHPRSGSSPDCPVRAETALAGDSPVTAC